MVKDDEIHKIQKKYIDLDLHDSSNRVGFKQ